MGFKRDRGVNLLDEIIETAKEIFPETEKNEVSEEKFQEIMNITKEVFPNSEVKEIVKQVQKPLKIKEKKKVIKKQREDTKVVLNVGITGNTIEVKDFRAIVKKKGEQINVVLNGIIAEWNHSNYNL